MKKYLIFMVIIFATGCSQASAFGDLIEGNCSASQKELITSHISNQLTAISTQDWPKAYSYAAESFKENITPLSFENIIKAQYSVMIDSKDYSAGECEIINETIKQKISVEGISEISSFIYRLTVENKQIGIISVTLFESNKSI